MFKKISSSIAIIAISGLALIVSRRRKKNK